MTRITFTRDAGQIGVQGTNRIACALSFASVCWSVAAWINCAVMRTRSPAHHRAFYQSVHVQFSPDFGERLVAALVAHR